MIERFTIRDYVSIHFQDMGENKLAIEGIVRSIAYVAPNTIAVSLKGLDHTLELKSDHDNLKVLKQHV